LCPASLAGGWRAELKKWIPQLVDDTKICILNSSEDLTKLVEGTFPIPNNSKKRKSMDEKIHVACYEFKSLRYLISSYDKLVKKETFDRFKQLECNTLIMDESQQAKKQTAIRTQHCLELAARTEHVVLLTGTVGTATEDAYAALHAIQPGIFEHFFKEPRNLPSNAKSKTQIRPYTQNARYFPFSFVSRWCEPFLQRTYANHYKWVLNHSTRTKEFYEISHHFGVIRRDPQKLYDHLPLRTRTHLILGLPKEEDAKLVKKHAEIASQHHTPAKRQQMFMEMYVHKNTRA
jgi:hypothetical protein